MVTLHALGALRATEGEADIPLGGPRQRRLLAALLLHRDEVVSIDRVADVVFEGAPSQAAATTLRSYVARLRRVLSRDGSTVRIETRSPGYRLCLAPTDFDVAQFEGSVAAARSALQHGEPASAARLVTDGLSRWHGAPYAEFADEEWVYPEVQRLTELRLVAQEVLVEAELACGHAEDVVPVLEGLCSEHPLREAYRAQLMRAYYASGRQADALEVLRAFRTQLAEELGIDPSPALVDLERRILVQDPTLLAPDRSESTLRGYLLGERLGTGRDGVVRAARLPGVEQPFVVKTLRASIADDPDFIRSFETRALAVASLRHPGALRPHDYWREPGAAHVVSPRLPGGTLLDRMHRRSLTAVDAVRLVDCVGGALATAHTAGLVHGDVSAENVLYDQHGDPVLSDFWLGQPRTPPPTAERDRDELRRLVKECLDSMESVPAGLTRLLDLDTGPAHIRVNPYLGLRAFDECDSMFYFGREALVQELVARFAPDRAGRLLLVVGASGTGKSSVVRAGLLPRLRSGAVEGSDRWFMATIVPTSRPYRSLAEGLLRIAPAADGRAAAEDALVLATELAQAPSTLTAALHRILPEDGELLLVIDQLEELFTLADEPDRRGFLDSLATALTEPGSQLRVVATLRADYYDRPLAHQPFGGLVNEATVAIPAMVPAEIERAVSEPARAAGREIEGPLVTELVVRMTSEPAALPALQFVLRELAERSAGRRLRLADYQALGGIEGAIAGRAEELYAGYADDRARVRDLFERLVVVSAHGEPTRRRALRAELGVSDDLVDRWAQARLLSLDVHPQNRLPTVEVAHEALVREWPRLRDWIEQDRSELVVLGRLREAAAAWMESGGDPSLLYRGANFEAALEVSRRKEGLPPEERGFIAASAQAHAEEQRRDAELIRRQALTNRRLRLQLAGIAVALVIALLGGVLALDQRSAALREGHVAVARELAAAADANLRDDPERSILLALAAVDATRRHGQPALSDAREALHRAVTSSRVLLSIPRAGGTADWTSDGRYLTSEGVEESGMVDLYDAGTGRKVRSWRGDPVDLNDVAFSRDSHLLATAGDGGSVKVWAVPSGRKLFEHREPGGGQVWGPALDAHGAHVAASWWDTQRVAVLSTRNGAVAFSRHVPHPEDTAFSPDGRRLAVLSDRADVLVLDAHTGREVYRVHGDSGIREVAWSPDGKWMAAAAGNGAALLFDARTGKYRFAATGHISGLLGVAWSRDSGRLATASIDGTAKIHELGPNGPREVLTLAAQDMNDGMRSVAFSPGGDRLMTSDGGVTAIKLWDVRDEGAAEVRNFVGGVDGPRAAVTSPDGEALYLSDGGTTIYRADLRTGRRTLTLDGMPPGSGDHVIHLALSRDGAHLAAATDRGRVYVWDTRDGALERRVPTGGPVDWIQGLAWSPSGRYLGLVTFLQEGDTIRIVDARGTTVRTIASPPQEHQASLSFEDEDQVLVSTGNSRDDPDRQQAQLWNWRRGKLVREYDAHATVVADDPTGRLVATDRLLEAVGYVWDRRTGRRLRTLDGHLGQITDIDFSSDGRRIATSSTDGTARVWNARTGELRVLLRPPREAGMGGVEFSADGARLVTTGYDGIIRVWTLDLSELIRIARHRLTRGMTTQECRRFLHTSSCPAVVRAPRS